MNGIVLILVGLISHGPANDLNNLEVRRVAIPHTFQNEEQCKLVGEKTIEAVKKDPQFIAVQYTCVAADKLKPNEGNEQKKEDSF